MEKDFGSLPNRGTPSKGLGLDLLSEVPLVQGRERWWSPRIYNKERRKNVGIHNGLIVSSLSPGLISTCSKGGMVWISVSISLLNSNACIDNATGGWKTYQIPDP